MTLKKLFLLVFSIVLSMSIVHAQNPQPGASGSGIEPHPLEGNGGYDILHMDLSLDWTMDENVFTGIYTGEAVATQDLSQFNMDFVGYEISLLQVNGVDVEFRREGYELIITPSDYLPDGEQFTILIHYSGMPESLSDPYSLYDPYGWFVDEDAAILLGGAYATASLYPSNYLDVMGFTVAVTVPEPMMAVGNGVLIDAIDNGIDSTFVWRSQIDSIFSNLLIGQYRHDLIATEIGVDINVYMLEEELTTPDDKLEEMLTLLSDAFGDYPFDELTIIHAPAIGRSGYADVGFIALGTFAVHDDLMVHELAHQWFGLTAWIQSHEDRWINEGAASYVETLWLLRRVYYENPNDMDDILPGILAIEWDNVYNLAPIAVLPDGFDSVAVYERGRFTFLMLQHEVGTETFFEIMREMLVRYRFDFVTTDDFVALSEEISGQDLSEFFDVLFYSEPLPPLAELGVE